MIPTPDCKIFCIGLNKTGTTSIGDALQNVGLRRMGWRPAESSRLMLRWYEHKKDAVVELARKYDVFEDLPWPLFYDWMDEAFPDAKFILTTRTSTDVWLTSIQAHITRGGSNWFGHRMIYGSYDPIADAHLYRARYETHNSEVRRHFERRPDKLLELVVGSGGEGDKLRDFLGIDREIVFPHANRRPDKPSVQEGAGVAAPGDVVSAA